MFVHGQFGLETQKSYREPKYCPSTVVARHRTALHATIGVNFPGVVGGHSDFRGGSEVTPPLAQRATRGRVRNYIVIPGYSHVFSYQLACATINERNASPFTVQYILHPSGRLNYEKGSILKMSPASSRPQSPTSSSKITPPIPYPSKLSAQSNVVIFCSSCSVSGNATLYARSSHYAQQKALQTKKGACQAS